MTDQEYDECRAQVRCATQRVLARLKARLLHEIAECRLELRSPPNIVFALDRLSNMEEVLERAMKEA